MRASILVVDDEPRGVELLARTLRDMGEVHTAHSGDEGWEIAQRTALDLVVADQRMPGMSGVELLGRVADKDERTGRILLTGYADHAATVDAINRGRVHAYLSKPCPPNQLRLTARSVLDGVQLARENQRLLVDLRNKNIALEAAMNELRAVQEQVVESERMSAIGRMIGMIIDDFRGPLSVIRSFASEVTREASDLAADELRDAGRTILEEVEHLTRMSNELLEVTRASESASACIQHDLDQVIHTALQRIVQDAAHAGIEVVPDLRAGVRLRLDEERLILALLNLFRNAIEAMPDGGTLWVHSEASDTSASIVVMDTGRGIPASIRDKLFEPFVSTGKARGCGLGLAVVKRVVQDHGGRIESAKAEGGGTAFHIHFPLIGSDR